MTISTNSFLVNPFALVAAGVVVVILLTMYIFRRSIRLRPDARSATALGLFTSGYGGNGVGAKIPVLADIRAQTLQTQMSGKEDVMLEQDWRWVDLMPVGARILPSSERIVPPATHSPNVSDSQHDARRLFTRTPLALPRTNLLVEQPVCQSHEVEVTVAITMPSPPRSRIYKYLDDESVYERDDGMIAGETLVYALGMARVPCSGFVEDLWKDAD